MIFLNSQKLHANSCTCFEASEFTIWGNSDLFEKNGKRGIKLLIENPYRDRSINIFDSILVFCSCGKLTIHYPYNKSIYPDGFTTSMTKWKWRTRFFSKGWRKNINLNWLYITSPKGGDASRTLGNISSIDLNSKLFDDMRINFVNLDYGDELQMIHPVMRHKAQKIFIALLYCRTYMGCKSYIKPYPNELGRIGIEIANTKISTLSICQEILFAIHEELFNLKGSIKSTRLKNLRIALEKACKSIGITLPELIKINKTPPELIIQLLKS